jgi:hypothetical protein
VCKIRIDRVLSRSLIKRAEESIGFAAHAMPDMYICTPKRDLKLACWIVGMIILSVMRQPR